MSIEYRVEVVHHDDGEVDVIVHGVGDSHTDRCAVAYALRKAADLVQNGKPVDLKRLN